MLGPPLLCWVLFSNFFSDLRPIFIIVETFSSSISLINDSSSIFAGTMISKSHSLVMNSSPLLLYTLTGEMCITLVPSPPVVELASSILPWKRCWPREVWLRWGSFYWVRRSSLILGMKFVVSPSFKRLLGITWAGGSSFLSFRGGVFLWLF